MKNMINWAVAALLLASAQQLFGQTLLVDRGLPTSNLNDVAGANRSNVSWAFTQYTPSAYWLVGDTFQNTSSKTWSIDTIRLWTTDQPDTAILRGGIDGSTIGVVSVSGTLSGATYADSSLYQPGGSGAYVSMYQVDFAVGITLAPGQVYDFFLDGTGNGVLDYQGNPIVVPFVHASNAALSGSPQNGSDDSMLYAYVGGGTIALGDVGTWSSSGDGWDKASDVNVQVYGSAPEGGSTLVLMGFALAGLGALRRRIRKN